MADYIINDKFRTTTDYSGPTPAWMAPQKGIIDPIEAKVECNLMGRLDAAKHSIVNCHDFIHNISPSKRTENFYSLAGMVGFRSEDIVKRIKYGKIFKLNYKKFGSILVRGHAQKKNKFILDQCNAFAKANVRKELILTDSWLATSIIESPEVSCLWDKAVANPTKYIVLVNKDYEECVKNQFLYYEKVYKRIAKIDNESNRKELLDRLNSRNIAPMMFETVNYAYEAFADARKEDTILVRCEGLSEEQLSTKIEEVVTNDQKSSKATKSRASAKANTGKSASNKQRR